MTIDISQLNKCMALRHAELVTGSKDVAVYVRFLHDAKDPNKWPAERKGTIAELWPEIVEFQKQGYGIFLIVNEGDADAPFALSDGRLKTPMVKDRNIDRIRAVFTDRDGPIEQNKFHLPPSFQLERDADHKHSYWLVSDCPVSEFRSVQKRLIQHYGTDKAICNEARVMRLGGTLNCKAGRPPMLYKLIEPHAGCKMHKLSEVLAGLPELPAPKPSSNLRSDDPLPELPAPKPSHNLGSDDLRVLTPETVEKMFAHFDPTLKGERGIWYGAIRLLAEHGIALTREPDEWWQSVAVDWSDGTLRRKYVDAGFLTPETFKRRSDGGEQHDTKKEIGNIFAEANSTPYEGPKFTTGSLIYHARAGGYKGSIDDRPAAEQLNSAEGIFAAAADVRGNEDSEGDARGTDRPLVTGSDIEIARCVLADLRRLHGEIIHTEGAFYRYDGKRWAEIPDNDLRLAVHRYDSRTYGTKGAKVRLTQPKINSIIHEMGVMCSEPDFFEKPVLGINCANGFIQFDSSGNPSLATHSPDQRARHVIGIEWDPYVDLSWEAPLLQKLLSGCFKDDADQEERIALIGEICGGAALGNATKLTQPKAIVLHGPHANNGKSELLVVMRGVLPPDAISAVSPSKFELDPMVMRLRGKTLNAVDELGSSQAITSEVFKGIITGNPRTARDLYKSAEEIYPVALHVFATNRLPPFRGGFDNGVRRRLMVLPMTRVIPEDERVPGIGARTVALESQALLAFVVDGASRLIRQGHFTEPSSCREALRQWVYGTDPVLAWLAECTEFVPGHRTAQKAARADFEAWGRREGFDPSNLARPNVFAQRVLGSDAQLDHAQNHELGRYFIGLRIRPRLASGTLGCEIMLNGREKLSVGEEVG